MALYAYVQGDVTVITQILSQVAMIFGGDPYTSAMKAMIMLGLVMNLFGGLALGGRLSIMSFFWPIIIVIVGVVPRTDLVFEDPAGGISKVDDLPIIVAAPISLITKMGYGLTEMIGDNIGISDLSMTIDNGAIVALRAPTIYQSILTRPNATGQAAALPNGLNVISDPATYAKECLGYAIKNGIRQRTDVYGGAIDTQVRVPNFYFMVAGSNGINYACQDYYDAITAGIDSSAFEVTLRQVINEQFGRYANDTTTGQQYQNALDRLVSNRHDFYKAVVWETALAKAGANYDAPGGGGSTAVALADALNQRMENSRGTAAMMFESIHTTVGFVEAWSLSIMPLMVLVMLLGPIGTKIGGKYLWLLVWVQLWFPCILIVLGYLDVEARNISYSATTSLAALNGFMSQLMRLQDMGYSQLSMVTMLSMFLIFGASAVFGTALQREMAGGDFYDEKKNMPDTFTRSAQQIYQPSWETTATGGTIGYGADQAFGNWTFSLDKTLMSSVTSTSTSGAVTTEGETVNKVASLGTGSQFQNAGTYETGQRVTENAGVSNQSDLGVRKTSSVGSGNEESAGRNEMTQHSAQLSAGGGGALGIGGGTGGGGGGGGAQGGMNFSGRMTNNVGNASSDQRASSSRTTGGTDTNLGSQDQLQMQRREDVSNTNGANLRQGADVTTQARQDETGQETKGRQQSKSDNFQTSRGDHARESLSVSTVDGRRVANNISKNDDLFRRLNQVAGENGLNRHINQWMASNRHALDQTFKDDERAKWTYAALGTMQGMTGYAGLTAEQSDYVNAASDDIMRDVKFDFSTGSTGGQRDLSHLSELSPGEGIGGDLQRIRDTSGLNRRAVEKYIEDIPESADLPTHISRMQTDAGKRFDEMSGPEVDGIFTGLRNRLDTLADYKERDGDFTKLRTDLGFFGAARAYVLGSDTIRDNDITNSYAKDVGLYSRFSTSEPEGDPEQALTNRMDQFIASGSPGAGSEPARYMALAQLYTGATAMGHDQMAKAFQNEMNAMKAADPALARAAPQLERLALSSASQEGIASRLPQAGSEYDYQKSKLEWESNLGREINDQSAEPWGATIGAGSSIAAYGVAQSMLGLHESRDRDQVVSFLRAGGEGLDPNDPWCAAFMNSALQQQGVEGTGSNMARSFLNWGQEVTDGPRPGDVVVTTRGNPDGPSGHVGFFDGYNRDGSIRVLGGNTGDKVGVSSYAPGSVLGIRRAG